MRPDMDRVVIERPRYGSSMPSKKTGLKILHHDPEREYDEISPRISSGRHRQYGWNCKMLTDNLQPLKRFLQGKVGKYWNKVYSEIATTMSFRSMLGDHLLQHLNQFVEKNVMVVDGKLCVGHWGQVVPLSETTSEFYVHPISSQLLKTPARKRQQKQKAELTVLHIEGLSFYIKGDGIWYKATFKLPEKGTADTMVKNKMVKEWEVLNLCGGKHIVATKQQCGKKELKILRNLLAQEAPKTSR